MTVGSDQLPRPSIVNGEPVGVLEQSESWQQGSPLLTRRPDPALDPMVWELAWIDVRAEVARVIEQHAEAYGLTDFDWTPPWSSTPVRVVWADPPLIQWQNPTTATVTGALEEVPAHD